MSRVLLISATRGSDQVQKKSSRCNLLHYGVSLQKEAWEGRIGELAIWIVVVYLAFLTA